MKELTINDMNIISGGAYTETQCVSGMTGAGAVIGALLGGAVGFGLGAAAGQAAGQCSARARSGAALEIPAAGLGR